MVASVRLHGMPVGELRASASGALSFTYLPAFVAAVKAGRLPLHGLSARLPVADTPYGEDRAGPYFDGLLPDNANIRSTLARYFQLDASDDYRLLLALGRECPGAVAIVEPDAPIVPEDDIAPDYDLLDAARLARHIADLPRRPLFVDADGELRLSLPGVHHKTALLLVGDQLALPRGNTPTSHILKVDIDGLPDSVRVEHFCLRAAASVGLDVPRSSIRRAEDRTYMLIARYDRVLVENNGRRHLRRLHQEDFCQALGRYPREKYEKDGGPGWPDCFALMRLTADPAAAVQELLGRAIFQFLIGNPDAHAKNYALVYRGNRILLSKLYDVNNAAAFRLHYKEQRPRLAMFIGGERDPALLTGPHWDAFAAAVGLRRELVRDRLRAMATALPEQVRLLREGMRGSLADTPLLDQVVADVRDRCGRVADWY